MRVVFVVAVLAFLAPALPSVASAQPDPVSCASYDAWEWAQLVFESDRQQYAALDADGDGTACPQLPRGVGFAPAIWTDTIPTDAEQAEIIRLIDGDTLEVLIDGVSNRVRIYRADTPETQNEHHCGGPEATAFAEYVLSFNDTPGVVYLERDANTRDRYGRELAYVWFTVDGEPYMLNHILITNGWAEDVDYGDRKYDSQFKTSSAFAQHHTLGVYELCGEFGKPDQPAPAGPGAGAPSQPVSGTDVPQQAPETQVPQTEVPYAPQTEVPYVPETEVPAPGGGCDPNYTPCVPLVSYDLDCADIGHSVTVIGGDPHGFDRDGDGYGCESW